MLISKNELKKINKIGVNELRVESYLQQKGIDENCKNKDEKNKKDIQRKCTIFTDIKNHFYIFIIILIHL